jgi:hypothetical protein
MKNKKAARNFIQRFDRNDEFHRRRMRRIARIQHIGGWLLLAAACVFASNAYPPV